MVVALLVEKKQRILRVSAFKVVGLRQHLRRHGHRRNQLQGPSSPRGFVGHLRETGLKPEQAALHVCACQIVVAPSQHVADGVLAITDRSPAVSRRGGGIARSVASAAAAPALGPSAASACTSSSGSRKTSSSASGATGHVDIIASGSILAMPSGVVYTHVSLLLLPAGVGLQLHLPGGGLLHGLLRHILLWWLDADDVQNCEASREAGVMVVLEDIAVLAAHLDSAVVGQQQAAIALGSHLHQPVRGQVRRWFEQPIWHLKLAGEEQSPVQSP
mmetsp:Transcript_100251/g.288012  ORF Transcript_100251/g.288012 Transcript_100251/m.288012 type:complete len:274 (-) Transcript_100251:354-1175(-)